MNGINGHLKSDDACRSEGAAIVPIYQTATFGYHGCLGSRPTEQFTSNYTRPADNPNHKVRHNQKVFILYGKWQGGHCFSCMPAMRSLLPHTYKVRRHIDCKEYTID